MIKRKMSFIALARSRSRKWLRSLLPTQVLDAWHGWLRWRIHRNDTKVFRKTGGRIIAGPFAGLAFLHVSDGVSLGAKLLGTYELEVSRFVREIVAGRYDLVVNAGAADGYYCVGLLWLMPHARAVAFESEVRRRQWIGELARLNDVHDRLTIAGVCKPDEIQSALASSQRPVVICDIEGGEFELLDPVRVPALAHSDVLVELHDFIKPEVASVITERFLASHDIESVWSRDRTIDDLPRTRAWRTPAMLSALSERRPGRMQWLWMTRYR